MANSIGGGAAEATSALRKGSWPLRLSALVLPVLLLPQGADAGTPLFANSEVVRELTPNDWGMLQSSKHCWFVDFYADWCPHCMHFAPIWERIASSFRGDSRVSFAAVDCAVHTEFCVGLQVEQYPTLRSFRIPGVDDSFKKTGAFVHEGEYHADEQADLAMLLQGKLLALGPDPKGGVLLPSRPGSTSVTPYPKPEEPKATQHTATMRLFDAEVALTYALHQGTAVAAAETKSNFFKKDLQDNDMALGGDALKELISWLDFLSVVFPSARARNTLRELASVARMEQARTGVLPRAIWIQALESRPIDVVDPSAGSDPSPHFKICTTYTCGLWTMFHLITVSAVQYSAETQSSQVLERIRGFVANFFGCADCQKHFLKTYDSCAFGRCQLSPQDGRGAALYMWQVHNNVTLRVAAENGLPIPGQWPPTSLCPTCWAGDGDKGDRDDSMKVWQYLVRAYTPALDVEEELGLNAASMFFRRDGRFVELWSNRGVRLACFLSLAVVLIGCLCWWNSARNDRSPVAIAHRSRGRPHYLRTDGGEQMMDQGCGYTRPMHVLHPNSIVMTM